jgi:hypothetical protein
VAEAADVSTRVEAEPFVIRREVFEYLLDRPDFATHVTRALRMGTYRIWRETDGLHLDDGWGTTGRFWLIHTGSGARVMRAKGTYKKPLFPAIQGEAVTVIEYRASPEPEGRSLVRATVTGFARLDSRFLAMGLRMASSLAQRKADREALRLMKLFAKVSRALDRDAEGVVDQLRRHPEVPRRELEEFARLISLR